MRFSLRGRDIGGGVGVADEAVGVTVDSVPRGAPALEQNEGVRSTLNRPELIAAKLRLHRKLIDEINLTQLDRMSRAEIRPTVLGLLDASERVPLNTRELGLFVDEVIDELTGLGPLEPLLKDPTISDILINTHESVYVERQGILEPAAVRFKDEAHVLRIVNKIVAAVGRRVDESSPMVDARLHDGSRINAAIRPVAVDGPLVSIRKFAKQAFDLTRLVENATLKPPMAALLREAVRGRLSMMISGGTGSGKTTLLNALSRFISNRERVITIEDAAELQLQQPHVGRLETRPPNLEGKGEIRQRELVKNALRMRPDRILIGEVRGEEAFDMLNAMNTGHEGSLTTIHANSARDAIARLEQMVAMAGLNMSENAVRAHIASAIRIIVQMQRLHDGQRKITSIHEITGMEGSVIQMQELYRFVRVGTDQSGGIKGEFRATGLRPSFLDALVLNGANSDEINLDPGRPL
jgi:pilus assembly protein CpaF